MRKLSGTCCHELFEAQVARTPYAEAICSGEESLTYHELDRRASRLADWLQVRGVGSESRIGIFQPRTPELLVAMLGVLKAGGAYVPLDLSYPADRIAFILEDAEIFLLLTTQAVVGRLPACSSPVVLIDGESDANEMCVRQPLRSAPLPESLAYILYTSGSTGRPKGVMVPQRGLVNYLTWAVSAYGLTMGVDVPVHSPIGFDLTLTSLLAPLLVGARVILLPDERGGQGLVDALRRRDGWGLVKLTPAHLQVLEQELGTKGAAGRARVFVIGGEALFWENLAFWRAHAPDIRLINEYGPTETVVGCCVYEVRDHETAANAGPVPIGRPVGNTHLFIVDEDLRLVPPGSAGELLVGGMGVARGYSGKPDLTAAQFVPDPFSGEPGGRLYRTGDRVRQMGNGDLEFLGRNDEQVKIRGYRIELGEIEAALASHPAVREVAVVVARAAGEAQIVAYVVAHGGGFDVKGLRDRAESLLPAYMVPARFVQMDAMPLTSHGKVDKKALPAPRPERPEMEQPYVAPRNPVEHLVAGLWSDLLGIERVGVHDDFFELGGQSLLAMRILARLRERFGVDVSFKTIVEHPTVAALASLLSRTGQAAPASSMRLRPVPRDGDLPLSFSQERVWFLEQLDPTIRSYQAQSMIRLKGSLDVAAWVRSLTEILRRHEIFRTTYHTVAGRPLQRVHPPAPAEQPIIDLSGLAPEVRESELARGIDAELDRPFDVSRLPMIRWTLYRLAPDEHVWLNVEHHLVHDGWSFNLLIGELAALYRAFAQGLPSPLQEPELQFADFAVWQRQWVKTEEARAQVEHWKAVLTGRPTVLDLPTDRPRPKRQSFRGRVVRHEIPEHVAEDVRALSRREGVSLFMTMEAAFAALLARYSGQDQINVGSAVANRRTREVEALIGMIVNNVVLPNDAPGSATVRDLLRHVRQVCLDADAHQDVSFDFVVDALQPERDPSRNPIFQVSFSFHDSPAPALEFPGLEARLTEAMSNRSSKFDLNIICIPRLEQAIGRVHAGEAGITVLWESCAALFEEPTNYRMVAHYQNLLASMAADPACQVSCLPLLDAAEQSQILSWSVAEPLPGGDVRPVHELFAERARLAPEAPAVSGCGLTLSYGELDRLSCRLTRRLRDLGTGPEVVVGVCLDRSPAWVTAILAVLRAGGAYLPLDPSHPPARLTSTLEDAGARVLLTRAALCPQPVPSGLTVVDVDSAASEEEGPFAASEVLPDNLAYVIYTSGSTGRPKGVELSHRGLANLVGWHLRTYAVTPQDRATHVASAAFDASVWEVWPYLAAGASIHLPQEPVRSSPPQLLRWLAAEGITLTFLPTPLAEAVLAEELPAGLALRGLLTGGDRLHASPDRALPFRLFNHYGPTESTVVATAAEVAAGGAGAPPIGGPIAGTRAFVLDRELQLVAPGVPGELHLAGVQLARGYRFRPELTAERFIPDPWSGEPGGCLYGTGDLVRSLRDGSLEFLGRLDQQVKIRGFRIELGEIEAVMERHLAVEKALVVARPAPATGAARLVGYWVPAMEVSREALRAFLAERLPEYMVPSALVELAAFPLNTSGKVDVAALPEPENGAEAGGFSEPRTPLERVLAAVWAELVGVQRVALEDNFFQLGGHSLLAARMLARVFEAIGIEVPLQVFFEAPTLDGLMAAVGDRLADLEIEERESIELRLAGQAPAPEPRIPRRAREGPVPLGFAQERLWFLEQLVPGSAAYHIARAFALRGNVEVGALVLSLGEVLRRHEALRTTFAAPAGRPFQIIAPELSPRLPLIDLSGLPQHLVQTEGQRLRVAEARRPFDLQGGPLLRLALLRVGGESFELLLTLHHIVADGWSLGILYSELSLFYSALSTGRSSPALEPAAQYPDFALWQREKLCGEELDRLLAYWRRQLEDVPSVLDLSADRPASLLRTYVGERSRLTVPEGLARDLRKLAQCAGATPFMVLSAGFSALLHRLTGQERLAVGLPVAGRIATELEGAFGLFVNTLALAADLSGNPGFLDHLSRVRQATLGALAHQEMPFEMLVAELAPERSLAHSPLFQVMLSVQNTPAAELELGGVDVTPLEVWSGTSQFDLSLSFVELSDGIAGTAVYDRERFDASTIRRLQSHLLALLAGAVADPGVRLSELPLLAPEEQHQVLRAWNETAVTWPEVPVHRLFERQAMETPSATAVTAGDLSLTYAELERRANGLAHTLRKLGVEPDVPVGLALERSADMLVSLLAVLKSGGAYVPLDPSHPRERLAAILADARPPVLLTQASLRALLPEVPAATRVVEVESVAACEERWTALEGDPDPENRAYILFTSGSTGRPKGVEVRHRSLANFLLSILRKPGIEPGDTMLAVTTLAFDIAAVELLSPLLRGAHIVLAGREEAADASWLTKKLAQGITVMQATPATWRMLVDSGWQGGTRLRAICGGEALPVDLAAQLLHRVDELWNIYGPTETTIWSTARRVDAGESPVRVGGPLANTLLYVVDRNLQPLPIGVPGELAIGGDGLARGYLGQPALTAERFIPDPFGGGGARLFRTGDLVRRLADGDFEFLGRIDHQVKIRGFRIELGEIEATLGNHPTIRQRAVVVQEDGTGERCLVAYFTCQRDMRPTAQELRRFLKDILPGYMIPSAFVQLEELPLSGSGKVDRRALAARPGDRTRTGLPGAFVAPRSALEEVLSALFSEVVGLERVGIHDGFFDLGGHSLKVAQVVATMREIFRIDFPLRTFFLHPTVAGLAEAVFADDRERAEAERVALLMLDVNRLSDDEIDTALDQRGSR